MSDSANSEILLENSADQFKEKLVKDMSLYLADHPIKELMELVMKSIEISGRHN